MPHQILYMGNFNVAGICHAISCKWIKQSRLLGNVNTLQELESPMAMFTNWQLADDWRGINENYHLPAVEVLIRPHLDGQWLAEQSTRINGYALIILWGGGISVQERAHIREGHTVAVRKQPGRIQYFDPNIGAFEFANSLEMYNWLPADQKGPVKMYPTLRNRQCEFVKV